MDYEPARTMLLPDLDTLHRKLSYLHRTPRLERSVFASLMPFAGRTISTVQLADALVVTLLTYTRRSQLTMLNSQDTLREFVAVVMTSVIYRLVEDPLFIDEAAQAFNQQLDEV